jgi:hypothetical protein
MAHPSLWHKSYRDEAHRWQAVGEALISRGYLALVPYFMKHKRPRAVAEAFLSIEEGLRPLNR